MVKVIAGLGILFICAYVFLDIHQNALIAKEKASRIFRTFLGDYGSYLVDSHGFGVFIVIVLLSIFSIALIVWGCFFDGKKRRIS